MKKSIIIIAGILLLIPFISQAAAHPDPDYHRLTYTLPKTVSSVRLSLPAKISDIFYGPKTGLAGFGLHAGGHIEGLDHVWIELPAGVAVKSWAKGTVTDVSLNGEEYFITINYGDNLEGTHMEIQSPYVAVGDKVARGQEVGLGMSYDPEQSSAEFSLRDRGRQDGVIDNNSSLVSPYDYLRPKQKNKLVHAYKTYMLKPYLAGNLTIGTDLFNAYEPKLTNRINLAARTEGKIAGVWYSLETWADGYPNDILTFIKAKNKYYHGRKILGMDDESQGGISDWNINGNYEVNYETNQIHFTNDLDGKEYFGIFAITTWKKREKLTIEYQEGSYPISFSENALEYVSRKNVPRRVDAVKLGVRETL